MDMGRQEHAAGGDLLGDYLVADAAIDYLPSEIAEKFERLFLSPAAHQRRHPARIMGLHGNLAFERRVEQTLIITGHDGIADQARIPRQHEKVFLLGDPEAIALVQLARISIRFWRVVGAEESLFLELAEIDVVDLDDIRRRAAAAALLRKALPDSDAFVAHHFGANERITHLKRHQQRLDVLGRGGRVEAQLALFGGATNQYFPALVTGELGQFFHG